MNKNETAKRRLVLIARMELLISDIGAVGHDGCDLMTDSDQDCLTRAAVAVRSVIERFHRRNAADQAEAH